MRRQNEIRRRYSSYNEAFADFIAPSDVELQERESEHCPRISDAWNCVTRQNVARNLRRSFSGDFVNYTWEPFLVSYRGICGYWVVPDTSTTTRSFPEHSNFRVLKLYGVSLQFARTYSKTRNFEKPFVPLPFKLLPLRLAVPVIITARFPFFARS